MADKEKWETKNMFPMDYLCSMANKFAICMEVNMEYIAGKTRFKLHNSAVSLGKFDGIHIGHQLLLNKIIDLKKEGFTSVVFSFLYHPGNLFSDKDIKLIYTEEEKKKKLEENGLDVLVSYPFSLHTAKMEPEEFISNILIKQLDARVIVAGSDFRFGHDRRGDIELLRDNASKYGYELIVFQKASMHNQIVSSTTVRRELELGHMEAVNEMLGTPYSILGEVLHGRKLGKALLGIPTTNLIPEEGKLLPPNGVYASTIEAEGRVYKGITNIGFKPTVGGERKKGAETFLFGFDGDLYGKIIRVSMYNYARKEIKFSSLEDLSVQMQKDIDLVKELKYFL